MKRLLLVVLLFVSFGASAQVGKDTYIYAVKGDDTLRLDRYYTVGGGSRPCMIFMFGGGFYTGTRDNKRYVPFFEYYAARGYDVVSIDYRLGLKKADFSKVKKLSQFVGLMNNTITMAVEDLYDATNYVLGRSAEWGVDGRRIVTCGSSAGAISVLQGEYHLTNGSNVAAVLPHGFRYAGVVSFAGAIFSTKGKIKWSSAPAPIIMFHGDADSNVPYKKFTVFGRGFYGSEYINKTLDRLKVPHTFCSFIDYTHEIAWLPMDDNRYDIDEFLVETVGDGGKFVIEKNTRDLSRPKLKKNFGIKDYLKSNF